MKTIWTIGRCVRPLAAMGLHEKIIISANSSRVRFKETSASNELPIEVDSIVEFNDSDFCEIMKEHDAKILAELRAINERFPPIASESIVDDASSKKDKPQSLNIDEWNVVKASWENNSVLIEFKSEEEAKEFFEIYKTSKLLK
ncbi:MAG: hypothetical protein CTY12_02145 [Methylotenera sp.]|nr:MAG: hypothetical protein CTY12_02145 [Methylotenera sp.]